MSDLLHNSVTDNLPVISQGRDAVEDGFAGDFASAGTDIVDLGLTGVSLWGDPLGALISAGLGFLLDTVKPLDDMLNWVTGDAGAISDHRNQWEGVGKQLTALADEMSATLAADFAEWQGAASVAAKAKLDGFIEGVRGTAAETSHIMSLLALSKSLMTVAKDVIKDLISQFVEWLIVTWLAAQAAAIPTCGGSEVAAGAATAGEAAVATSRGAAILAKVMAIFRKLQAIIAKIAKSLKEMRATSILKLTGKGGNKALAGKNFGKDLVEKGKDARKSLGGRNGHRQSFKDFYDPMDAIKGGANKIAGGFGQSFEDEPDQLPSSDEIDNLLNP